MSRRIVVLCSDLGVKVPGSKGASLHLQAVAAALARAGNEVLLVATAGAEPPPESPPGLPPGLPGLRYRLLPHPGRSAGLRRELRKLRYVAALPSRVAGEVAAFGPDLIYERLALFGTGGRMLARRRGVPHVLEVNALLAAEEARWRGLRLAGLARRRELAVLAGADLRVAVSEQLASAVREQAGEPTVVVPNGVAAELFARLPDRLVARRALGLPPDVPVLAFTGALRPWHGLDVAIRALSMLPGVRLAVAGTGPVQGDLAQAADRLGVGGRVHWLGAVAHDRVPWLLAAADVGLAPYPALSDFAFSPLKVYEYRAAGLPVIASDLGQLRELVADGRTGRLVTPGDPVALAGAVCNVLGNPQLAAAAAAARPAVLAAESWDARAARLTELFAALPAGRPVSGDVKRAAQEARRVAV